MNKKRCPFCGGYFKSLGYATHTTACAKKYKQAVAVKFVEHIRQHLRDMNIEGKVICKICGKDIYTIYKESIK